MLGGDFQARELVIPSNVEQNGRVENYSFPEESLQHVPETENIMENSYAVQQSNGSLLSTMNPVQDHLSSPIEEPAEEPQKHTYASIVCTKSFTSINLHPLRHHKSDFDCGFEVTGCQGTICAVSTCAVAF